MNITNPVYTSVSDSCYYCHLTDTGVWLCEGMNVYGTIGIAFGIGVVVAVGVVLIIILILVMNM